MITYPKTKHLRGSKGVYEDDQTLLSELEGYHVVIEEKLDGSEVSIHFGSWDNLVARHRNNPTLGQEFDQFWPWVFERANDLYERLKSRYVLFGEWLYAKHTVFYDRLPSYFMAYDIYDQEEERWLTTAARLDLLDGLDIHHVPVLFEGAIQDAPTFYELLHRPSLFKTDAGIRKFRDQCEAQGYPWEQAWEESDLTIMPEGLYLKAETGDEVVGFYKYIREGFLRTILESGSHWRGRGLLANQLAESE